MLTCLCRDLHPGGTLQGLSLSSSCQTWSKVVRRLHMLCEPCRFLFGTGDCKLSLVSSLWSCQKIRWALGWMRSLFGKLCKHTLLRRCKSFGVRCCQNWRPLDSWTRKSRYSLWSRPLCSKHHLWHYWHWVCQNHIRRDLLARLRMKICFSGWRLLHSVRGWADRQLKN